MKNKILAVVMASTTLAFTLTGCSSGAAPTSDNTSSATEGTSTTTGQDKVIVMGTNATYPPFEFVADNQQGLVGEYDGIDVAIGQAIADDMGYTLEIDDMPFDSLIMALQSGKVDFVAAGLAVTDDRKQNVDFSTTYYGGSQEILVPSDNTDINSVADLNNKIVGVEIGTTSDFFLTDNYPDVTLQRYDDGVTAVMDLTSGKIDAVVLGDAQGNVFLEEYPGLKAVTDDTAFPPDDVAIAVKKGNTELLDEINKVLNDMQQSGELDKIIEQYFTEFEQTTNQ